MDPTPLPPREQCGLFRGDGRLDFFARLKDREPWLFFYRTESGAFVEATKGPAFEFHPFNVGGNLFVTDWNSDGWPDLLLLNWRTEFGGPFEAFYLQNTVEGKMRRNSFTDHFRDIDMARAARFHAVDWNEDGEGDIVVKERGRLRLYELHHGRYREAAGIFDNVTIAYYPGTSGEALVDWDGDGDLDLVVAEKLEPPDNCWCRLRYYEKTPGGYREDSQHALAEFNELPVLVPVSNLQPVVIDNLPTNPPTQGINDIATTLQPIPIDWDGDGDLDVIIGPHGHFLENLENGSFRERTDSPFKSLPEASRFGLFCDRAWRFVDCDGDGDLDLVRLTSTSHFIVCVHKNDHSLDCDANPACRGADLRTISQSPLWSFDLEESGDGSLSILLSSRTRGLQRWSPDICEAGEVACHGKGYCLEGQAYCSCYPGHGLRDCSACKPHWYTSEHSQIGKGEMRSCNSLGQ